jgi:cellulose synthase/poly-beta-1,6-N-acetylglucosamine synthase-like glycosyltransferase
VPTDSDSLCRRTSIVIPAMNEAPSVGRVVSDLRGAAEWQQILVVDDGSTDDTSGLARAAGADVIRHPYNKGNGAAVKRVSATRAARSSSSSMRTASIVRRMPYGWCRRSPSTIWWSAHERWERTPGGAAASATGC